MNQDIEMCIFLDNTGDFIIGNYSAELYLEENYYRQDQFHALKEVIIRHPAS